MNKNSKTTIGNCACKQVKFVLQNKPMFTHCCHCHSCQRETGSAFALNALIETTNVELIKGTILYSKIPSDSGAGQTLARCNECLSVLWSHYAAANETVAFVRVGTLENNDEIKPDIHIYTQSKQQWLQLESNTPMVERFYRRSEYWPQESIKRYKHVINNNSE